MKYRIPEPWTTAGASFGRDGLLYLAEWRRGFTPGELRALFFDCQQVSTLRRERDAATARICKLEGEIDRLERSVWWLRRQIHAEARLGALIARLDGRPSAGESLL